MAISHLARRLLSPSTATTTAKLFPGTSFSNPHAYARNPLLLLDPHCRFSASPNTTPNPAAAAAAAAPEAAPIASGAAPVGVESAALVQGVAAFAFPFTAALVLRRVIKPVAFFQKMEANGRLQVLTLCLQASKNVNLMMLRTRVVAISCALGVSVGSVATILMR
ncbi:unnamed protein product [Triticum turgidum subsp. durum]|uniref:Uncharacterized protein n=1 Tax=Triticum turgidum subsp. durum TaxID=4567 RepID=A0A9R1B270_TRITD|nr:unnamed protein product [Triticum turgidum subsp. durum]